MIADVAGGNEIDPYLQQAQGELRDDESVLQLTVSSNWAKNAIESRHVQKLHEWLHRYDPQRSWNIRILVDTAYMPPPDTIDTPADDDTLEMFDPPTEIAPQKVKRLAQRRQIVPLGADTGSGLNPRYTFDSYVVGSSNRLAHAAAMGVAESPDGSKFNPFFIYGGVGLGKTHLLHAIGNKTRERNPNARVLYVSAETFTNDMVDAIRRQETNHIRNKYRTMDVLLMDDIQFLQRKAQTQIEFFHTFNDLHNANKQIVLASDSSPHDMSELEERVKSRFMWGMVASIDAPEVETRIAILQRKADELLIEEFPIEVAEYIAEQVTTNIRELEGTLSTIYRYAELQGRVIDADLVREVLKQDDARMSEVGRPISAATIQRVVADYYRMKVSDLKGKRRTKRLAQVRHIAMYLCRQMTDLSLVDIGQDFGGRDHSTVINACMKIEREIDRDTKLAEIIVQLTRKAQNS